jgi:hypothetical protein
MLHNQYIPKFLSISELSGNDINDVPVNRSNDVHKIANTHRSINLSATF